MADPKSELNILKHKLFGETATIVYRHEELRPQGSSSTNRRWVAIATCVATAEARKDLSSGKSDTLTTEEPKNLSGGGGDTPEKAEQSAAPMEPINLGSGEGDTPEQAEKAAALTAYEYLKTSYEKDMKDSKSSG